MASQVLDVSMRAMYDTTLVYIKLTSQFKWFVVLGIPLVVQ